MEEEEVIKIEVEEEIMVEVEGIVVQVENRGRRGGEKKVQNTVFEGLKGSLIYKYANEVPKMGAI